MTHLERQIRSAQHRLWIDRWLNCVTRSITVGGLIFAVIVLVQRLFDLPIPLSTIAGSLAVATVIASVIWTAVQRDDAVAAATALDAAAGLKERLSTGHYLDAGLSREGADDPFARAVVADAEQVSSSISARQHIRFHVPKALAASIGSVIVAALMLLITPGLLKSTEAKENEQREDSVRQVKVAVKRKMEKIRELIDTTPALEEFKDEAKKLNSNSGGLLTRPDEVRHEAAKKIDSLADAIKKKRSNPKYDAMREMRKRLRTLKAPPSDQTATQRLTKALQQGDFQKAKEEVKALQEQLATLKKEKDQKKVNKLTKQLDALAKQLEKVAENEKLTKKLAEKLAKAGVKKEEVNRLLESLKKKDLDQIQKALEKRGVGKEMAKKLAKQLKQNSQASAMAKKLAQSMKNASHEASSGHNSAEAMGLSSASDQLGELEQLEQEMTQLETTMAALGEAQGSIGNKCPQCNGTGKSGGKKCPRCGGSGMNRNKGRGMGNLGKGRGGLAPEESTAVSFKTERGKVKTTKGAIIGQFLIDGEQVKGEVDTDFVELMNSAEREASDSISHDRIPRQYQKAVKSYFSNVQKSLDQMKQQSKKDAQGTTKTSDTATTPHSD